MMDGEIWKPIPGFAGLYEASSLGRIRSLPRSGVRNRKIYGGAVRQLSERRVGSAIYQQIVLSKHGKPHSFMVHRLICLAFHGLRPSIKYAVAHGDGNPSNNRADNLRWATYKENEADKIRHGTKRYGETSSNVRLTETAVCEIREKYAGGAKLADLAREYGVKKPTIFSIITRQNWAWVPGGERQQLQASDPRLRPGSHLTETQAREIIASKESRAALAARYGVTMMSITNVRVGRTWKHLERPLRINSGTQKAALVWRAV